MVGASGVGAARILADAEEVAARAEVEEVLVQEFIPGVAERGEYSLVFFLGEFSHAVRKFNTTGDFRIQAT